MKDALREIAPTLDVVIEYQNGDTEAFAYACDIQVMLGDITLAIEPNRKGCYRERLRSGAFGHDADFNPLDYRLVGEAKKVGRYRSWPDSTRRDF